MAKHVESICKCGAGTLQCKYLVEKPPAGNGIIAHACLKFHMGPGMLLHFNQTYQGSAKGDNCMGKPDLSPKRPITYYVIGFPPERITQ